MKPTPTPSVSPFGLIALSIIFLLLYGYFNTVGSRPVSIPDTAPSTTEANTVGALGGFHLIEGMRVSDEQSYYRVTLSTRLNRSTVIDQAIAVPLTRAIQVASDQPVWLNGQYQDTKNWGSYRLQVSLSDTSLVDTSTAQPVEVFSGERRLSINQSPITEIQLVDSQDGSAAQLLVGLSQQSRFKVGSTPSGTIYVDILK